MDDIWNDTSFPSPPVYTYKSCDKSFDVSTLHTILSDAVSLLESQQMLHREAALVSRLMYNMSRKFRHDIGHSYLRRTNTALLKYLNLEYIKDLNNFLSVVPEDMYEEYVYLPTRQMMEYLLVRTQTLGKVLFRINMCAKKAALFSFERLKRGDSAWLSIMPFSILARVWQLTKTFLKSICKLYDKLLPFLFKLNIIGAPILPIGYEFPEDFAKWINLNEVDAQSQNLWKSSDILSQFSTSDAQKSCDNMESSNNNDELPDLPKRVPVKRKLVTDISEDVGEKLSRFEIDKIRLQNEVQSKNEKKITNVKVKKHIETDKSVSVTEKTLKSHVDSDKPVAVTEKTILKTNNHIDKLSNNLNKHDLNSVRCLKSLKAFLKVEEKLRSSNIDQALSKNIGFIQWQSVKTTLCKKILKFLKKSPNVSAEVFKKCFQKLWSEKCS